MEIDPLVHFYDYNIENIPMDNNRYVDAMASDSSLTTINIKDDAMASDSSPTIDLLMLILLLLLLKIIFFFYLY